MAMRRAPASIAFSTSSFTTDAGRSTTSPAAIWLERSAGRRMIRGTADASDPAPASEEHEHDDDDDAHDAGDPPELLAIRSGKAREQDVHAPQAGQQRQ